MKLYTLSATIALHSPLLRPSIRLDTIACGHSQECAALLIQGPSSLRIDRRVWADDELNTAIKDLPLGNTLLGNKTGNTVFWLYRAGLNQSNQLTLNNAGNSTETLVMLVESPGMHFTLNSAATPIAEVWWGEAGQTCHSRLLQVPRGTIITDSLDEKYLWDGNNLRHR